MNYKIWDKKEKINNVGDLEKIMLKYIDEFSRIMSI